MALTTNRVPAEVHLDVADDESSPATTGITAKQGADPRVELAECERLDQVVVGAVVETGDTILEAVACGEHQDAGRLCRAGRFPESTTDLPAVDRGHREVQADEVVSHLGGLPERLGAVERLIHRVPLPAQAASDRSNELHLVIGDEHSHRLRRYS